MIFVLSFTLNRGPLYHINEQKVSCKQNHAVIFVYTILYSIGNRTWKLYYAAKAKNWPLAKFQAKEIRGLMELGAFTRPKYEDNLNQFLTENWKPIEDAIAREDLPGVETAFHKAVDAANAFHELRDKPYIRWKLPDTPPPDLDLTPRKK